ncbi:MAG TPA: hydrogenase [Candidatus Eisenbacteria bacterium]|jgi:hydrogenase-4 component E
MHSLLDTLMVLLVFTNLRILGLSRINASIRTVAAQGVLLGLVALVANADHLTGRILLIAVAGIALKGIVFPVLLFRALRAVKIRREVEPFVGYIPSVLAGVAAFLVSLWVAARLPLPGRPPSDLIVPAALSTLFVGLLVIVSRKKALSQTLGYLVFENGVYAFGVGVAYEAPALVEMGILLDVFVAVFVMGIIVFHIAREFDSIDTTRLATLKE